MTDWIPSLREALLAADYTFDASSALLGSTAHAALGRNETTPGLRATRGDTPLETLTRLWLLQAPVTVEAVERALPGLLDPLCAAGVLSRSVSEVVARIDLRPHATEERDLWVAGDLTPGLDGGSSRVGADHVLGISPAATSLAQLTLRDPVARALDLGTGCGVQSLHLAGHVDDVVATDVNRRALRMTTLNAELNEVEVDVREGSFFEPVAGELFDLITTNPPFVISPATGERLVYRDSGLPGDRAVEHIVRTIPRHLTDHGTGQVLANWLITTDRPWQERLGEWLTPDVDAWIVQREVLDLPSYVELWLKDAGLHGAPDYRERYDTWLSWFEDSDAQAVGFGWISLRNGGSGNHLLEEWRWEVEQPIGPEIAAHFERIAGTSVTPRADPEGLRLIRRDDVVQETHGPVGAEDPETIVLRQQRGMRRARQVDTVVAGLVGACDGELSIAQILGALATLLERDEDDLRSTYLPVVRELIAEGYLLS